MHAETATAPAGGAKAAQIIKEDRKAGWSTFLLHVASESLTSEQHINLLTLIFHANQLALRKKRETVTTAEGGWEKAPLPQEGCPEQLHPVCELPVTQLPRASFSVALFSF